MNKIQLYILFFIFGLLPVCSFGQFTENSFYTYYSNDDWIDTDKNSMITLSSTYFASPYSAPTYLNTFILLHYNEENLKKEIAGKLNRENYFGIDMRNTYRTWPIFNFKLSGKNFGLGIFFRNVYDQRMYFTDDLFRLMYEGNVPFAGKIARIAPLDFSTVDYFEGGFELVSRTTDRMNFGMGLSLIQGNSFYEFSATRGTLFTSEDGDSLHTDIKLNYRSSDPDKKEFSNNNGTGAGFSAFAKYDINKKSSLYLALDDLGFISWNDKSINFSFDSSVSYTGFDIFDQSALGEDPKLFIDTFFNISKSPATSSYLMWLKPRVNLIYSLNTGVKGSKLIVGVTYRFDGYSMPGIYLQYRYKPVNNLFIKGGISYDEYSRVGGNLELGIRLFKKLVFSIGSYHVEQFVTSMNGQSLYFDLTGVFGK
jgi:hypothetical protein